MLTVMTCRLQLVSVTFHDESIRHLLSQVGVIILHWFGKTIIIIIMNHF